MIDDCLLIIEDDPDWQNRIDVALSNRGKFTLERASDFQTAISKLDSLSPLALILDMKLGGGEYDENDWEGWELARHARENGIATVIVTGLAEAHISSRAFREFNVIDLFDKGYFLEHRPLFFQRVIEAMEATRRRRAELIDIAANRERYELEESGKFHEHGIHETVKLQFEQYEIGGIGQKIFLRINNSRQGEPHSEFTKPFPDNEFRTLEKIIHEERAEFVNLRTDEEVLFRKMGIDSTRSSQHNFLEQVGIQIYDALSTGRAGAAITNVVQNADASKTWATFQIRYDAESVELANCPWELIHDGFSFLAKDQISLVRYVSCPLPISNLRLSFPLKVLMLVSRPFGLPQLRDDEDKAIRETINEIGQGDKYRFERLSGHVSYNKMMDVLDEARRNGVPFDVIYFDGHGHYGWKCSRCGSINEPEDEGCNNPDKPECSGICEKLETFLFFENEMKQKDAVGVSAIETALVQSGVQMVLLSACSTGKVGGNTVFNSFGPKLIARLVPVVLAMQFPIKMSDTLLFFKSFFRSLSEKDTITIVSIENAVRYSRRFILSDRWFYPVLYLRAR